MGNPILVRKPAIDANQTGEVSKTDILNTNLASQNYIINGDMRISQRGTSFTAIASGTYSLDRWKYYKSGAAVHTVTQDTDAPTLTDAGYLFRNSLRLNLTTPDTSIASGDFVFLNQNIEGYNWAPLAQKVFTLSFWVKATTIGTYCVSFLNAAADRSYVAEYTINTTATWEYKTVTVAASPSTGTWDYTNGAGLQVTWVLAAGSSVQTTAGAWQNGSFNATANQVNGVNTGSTDFRITGVMINGGSTASPFSTYGKTFDQELAACYRYYNRHTNVDGNLFAMGYAVSATIGRFMFKYPVTMRTAPTGSWSNTTSDYFNVYVDGTVAFTGITFELPGSKSMRVQTTGGSGYSGGVGMRLEAANGNAFFAFDAEL